MASFKEAYLDLATMVSEAKEGTGLSEETLLDLIKTQLVYGQAPISREEPIPTGEYIGGEETEFTEDTDVNEGTDDGDVIPFPN